MGNVKLSLFPIFCPLFAAAASHLARSGYIDCIPQSTIVQPWQSFTYLLVSYGAWNYIAHGYFQKSYFLSIFSLIAIMSVNVLFPSECKGVVTFWVLGINAFHTCYFYLIIFYASASVFTFWLIYVCTSLQNRLDPVLKMNTTWTGSCRLFSTRCFVSYTCYICYKALPV